ncbi:MAG TPA: sigma 54-interacting transcriptional regulator [Sedimentibacter sp.]|jgi:PAS domain S-box-containing protein|nr:sigma 54-interacting transcriptional regulator [Sedimentibacter sp.]HHZ00237.1 sigma 54-interacting transcriptional regulator [Tissierellia bacterium]HOW22578.1 sigma 54-interacting transcriptional regulator [Sedimentibacter sp.]HRC80138.1 sigma 54-interacting transcriptional regulator [Sedimentibacter sp.]
MDFANNGREKFEYILDNIPDAITIVDNYGKVIFFNSTAEEYFNLKKSDIIDKDLVEFFPNAILLRVLDSRTSFNNIYNSPRENSFVVSSAVPLYDRERKMIGALARDRDITEIVRLSELLNKTRMNLLKLENEYSKKYSAGESYFSRIISNNTAFIEIINLCKNISKTPLNILLKGESGTGKELFAKAIHYESGRKGKFIPINCSAIPRELFESEIFGYEAGAFTGAKTEGKKGKFEEAEGGTIFLDEIADLPLELQPKLLRVLEDGVVTRIGGNKPKKIDVRIISATNKDIRELINEGKFRKDLYYRLDIFQVNIPPLRERKGDIILLANRFLQEFCMEQRISIVEIPDDIQSIFLEYKWEGNVRELRNVIQRSAVIASQRGENKIKKEFLPSYMQKIEVDEMNKLINLNELKGSTGLEDYLGQIEKRIIKKILEEVNYNKSEAAKILKIPRATLYYKMEKYGIKD